MVELELEPVDNIGYKFNLMAYPGKNVSLFLFFWKIKFDDPNFNFSSDIPLPKILVFIYFFLGEEVIFQPQSKGYLFDPDSLHVFVDHGCHLEVAVFNANKGHFVKGKSFFVPLRINNISFHDILLKFF